jgi:hypothetical protein
MNANKLYAQPCWNPYINGKNGKRVEKIHFFADGKILASVQWFTGGNGSNNRYPELTLPTELKEKRKEDLTLPFCFLFQNCVYIPANLVNFRENGEELDFECDEYIRYKTTFSIEIEAVQFVFEMIDGKGGYKKTESKRVTITEPHKHRQEDKPKFVEATKISDEFKNLGFQISRYDIFKLMKHYNFSKI